MMAIFSALLGDTVWYLDNRLSQDRKWSFCESVPVITDIDEEEEEEEEEALYNITSVHKEIILFIQEENDVQGNDVYRVRPSPFDLQGGMGPIDVQKASLW